MSGNGYDGVTKHTGLPEEEDFEALFEAQQAREAATGAQVQPGDVVRGRVVQVGREAAFVSLGAKAEGYIGLEELLGDDGQPRVREGEEIEAYVVSVEEGIKLSLAMAKGNADWDQLVTAFEAKIPVEGTVAATNKGGVEVQVAGQRAFCPASQLDLGFVPDMTVFVGQKLRFLIQKLGGGRHPDIVLSRRVLLEEERAEQARTTRAKVVEGALLEGRVRSVRDFGAFVDLGGIDGLVHVSEIAWERVSDPHQALKEGDTVTVKVLKTDWAANRISLSIKAALANPWENLSGEVSPGAILDGTVVRTADFGAFVELRPGLDGLVHVSELSWKRVRHPDDAVQVGDPVRVRVLEVDRERRRISLSVKQAESDDPWATAAERYREGTVVQGTVEKVETFGVFVELEPGVTALVPASETGTERGSDLRRPFPKGQKVTARVLSVNPAERRLSLSLSALAVSEERAEIEAYQREQRQKERGPAASPTGGSSFGTFGDLLRGKLDRRK